MSSPVTTPAPRKPKQPEEAGVPVWLPLAATLIALLVAVFVAIRICPTLSALVSPPDPVLPADAVLESHESKSTEDSWLYTTHVEACKVAQFYQQSFGACLFDPDSGCSSGKPLRTPGQSTSIARCAGSQAIAQYHILWTVVISTDTTDQTVFRIYREVN